MTLRTCLSLSVLSLALVALSPATALAGACPTCTTSADCTDPGGGPAFCVLHDGDVGCGSVRQICCPGQACNTFSGRPSCEGTSCTVVDGTDAGPPVEDAAAPTDDAAMMSTEDAGASSPLDSGTSAPLDASSTGADTGSSPATTSSSCGCRAGSPSAGPLTLLIAAGLGLSLAGRRRARG